MHCTKTVKEFSEAAGRKVEFCRELSGADDGTLGGFGLAGKLRGVTMEGGRLKWWTGVPIGAGAGALGAYLGYQYYMNSSSPATGITSYENVQALGGGLATALVSIPMMLSTKTRTAGYTTLGTGIAATVVAYMQAKKANAVTAGLPVAQIGRAPVRILSGRGGLGLPVAEEMSGAPVQVLTGSGAFGATIGTNFARR